MFKPHLSEVHLRSLTVRVISATSVPISPLPGGTAAILTSAKNSGKLRKHTARKLCKPSLRALTFSVALPEPDRRTIMSSQRLETSTLSRLAYAERARKVCWCNARLTLVLSCEKDEAKSVKRGVRREEYVGWSCPGEGSRARLARRLYSFFVEELSADTFSS